MKKNNIYNIDCEEGINQLKDKTVNLVCCSPPYNLGNVSVHNKIEYNAYQDNKDYKEYILWLNRIFKNLYQKMTEDGRICINIGDQKNGAIPTHFYIMDFMFKIGYNHYTTIIWNKNQIARRTAWGSFKSPSSPSFPTPFEYVLIFHTSFRKLTHKAETDLEKQEFIDWSLAIWNFAPETKMKKFGHPAMFPEELPKRCIKMFSYPGDLVVDPFSGMGTTCYVAKKLNRNYIGFENDSLYFSKSVERLSES